MPQSSPAGFKSQPKPSGRYTTVVEAHEAPVNGGLTTGAKIKVEPKPLFRD